MATQKKHRRRKKKRVPIKKRTLFVIAAMVNLTWYTITVLIISWNDHIVPSELTVACFAACRVESKRQILRR